MVSGWGHSIASYDGAESLLCVFDTAVRALSALSVGTCYMSGVE